MITFTSELFKSEPFDQLSYRKFVRAVIIGGILILFMNNGNTANSSSSGPSPNASEQVIINGGGIAGLSTHLFLAKAEGVTALFRKKMA